MIVMAFTEEPGSFAIHCPACGFAHKFDKKWTFNGDFQKPTFRASMLVRWFRYDEPDNLYKPDGTVNVGPDGKIPGKDIVCHSFVTDGNIEFLGDCTHELAGQTVPLPDID